MKGRTTTDILILMVAGTVCFSVIASGALLGIIAIKSPNTDTSGAANAIGDVINTLIGLLAGFLAGRTDATARERRDREREERSLDDVGLPDE